MPQADWGTKHTCQECGAKYYDMGRSAITCPTCGVELIEKPVLARAVSSALRPSSPSASKPLQPKPPNEQVVEAEGSLVADAEEGLPDLDSDEDVDTEVEAGSEGEGQVSGDDDLPDVLEVEKVAD